MDDITPNPQNFNNNQDQTPTPEQNSINSPPAQFSPPANISTPKKSSSKLLLSIFVLIVVAGAGVAGYLLYKHDQPKPVANTITKKDVPLIRIGTQDGPVNVLYPNKDSVTTSGFLDVNNQVFEGLVGWQGGTKIVPLLATSWTNPDDSTWDFMLRQDVKFHNGHSMTADDVKYSLDKYKDSYGDILGLSEVIKSIKVLAPNKVEIVTNGPDPILLNRLTYFYIIDSKNTKPDDSANGTGPFTIKAGTDPAKNKITDLVAIDNYWGGHVYTREIQYSQFLKEADEVAALKAHKIDLLDSFVDLPSITELKKSGITMVPQTIPLVDTIGLNTLRKGSPLTNLKFRQALNIGLNRSAIIKAAGVDGSPAGQFVTSAIPGYVPSIKAPVQDIVAAKALITASGIKKPSLTLSYGTDSSNQALAEEIQKELATIGVTVKLDSVDNLDDLFTEYQDGKLDMVFFANSTNLIDASDVLSVLQLPGVYDNKNVDDLLTKSNQILDPNKRLKLIQQAIQALSDDVAAISLYTRTSYYAQANTSYSLNLDVPGNNLGVYYWKVFQK